MRLHLPATSAPKIPERIVEAKPEMARIDYAGIARLLTERLGKDSKGRANYFGESYGDDILAHSLTRREIYGDNDPKRYLI